MRLGLLSWPEDAEVALVIRDDDISFFTNPEKLKLIYSNAWDRGFKISFGTIPAHRAVNNLNVPPEFRGKLNFYPIYLNRELIRYLKSIISKGRADVVQHGFCHSDKGLPGLTFNLKRGVLSAPGKERVDLKRLSEFYGLSTYECLRRIRIGRRILEESLSRKIEVFVAPQEYLSRNLWKALRMEGLYYCGAIGIRSIPISEIAKIHKLLPGILRLRTLRYPREDISSTISTLLGLPVLVPSYKHYWNRYLNKEVATRSFRHFKKIFQKALRHKSPFVIVTHYWEYFYDWQDRVTQTIQLEYLDKILDFIDEYNVWKCGLTELFQWLFKRTQL